MKLIDNACEWFKFWSVRLALVQSGVVTLWLVYPFPSEKIDTIFKCIVFGINVLIMFSRVVKQESLQPGDIIPAKKP